MLTHIGTKAFACNLKLTTVTIGGSTAPPLPPPPPTAVSEMFYNCPFLKTIIFDDIVTEIKNWVSYTNTSKIACADQPSSSPYSGLKRPFDVIIKFPLKQYAKQLEVWCFSEDIKLTYFEQILVISIWKGTTNVKNVGFTTSSGKYKVNGVTFIGINGPYPPLIGDDLQASEQESKDTIKSCTDKTPFNTPYGLTKYNPNLNCCNGFKLKTGMRGQIYKTTGSRGGTLGDLSYPRNQNGRWNTSTTNTKLYPVISKYKDAQEPISCNIINGTCQSSPKPPAPDITLKVAKQSGNIFKSTTNNMSKKQLYSYLSKNRAYLYR